MLPEFTYGGSLPAAAGLGTRSLGSDPLREMLADIIGHGGAGALEIEALGQFVGQQGKVERLTVRQKLGQELVGGGRPRGVVVAAGGLRLEGTVVLQPLMAQLVKTSPAEVEPLGGRTGIKLAVIEGGQDFLNVERGNAVS